MNNTTLQRFWSAIAVSTVLVGLSVSVALAANSANMPQGELGKLHAEKGVQCADCHGRDEKPQAASMLKCLDCHGETSKLAEATANVKPNNPHENRHYGTEADCNLCHHQHKKSENFCLPCHPRFAFNVP